MENYFATGEVDGRFLNRPTLQRDETGKTFSRIDLANLYMDDSRPCACVAYGAIAAALAALADRGTHVTVRGEISPFRCTLPTGRVMEQKNMLRITTFRIVDEPEVLPVA